MKILIAVDDSRFSQAATDFVRRFPWPADAEMLVLSVAQPVMVSYAVADVPAMSYTPELAEEATRHHQQVAERYEAQVRGPGIRTRSLVVRGDPREAIVNVAKDHGVDLVVVGSHGRSGLSKLIMGSVASHVVTHAPCGVLVVKLAQH